jgi:hypothetical protein
MHIGYTFSVRYTVRFPNSSLRPVISCSNEGLFYDLCGIALGYVLDDRGFKSPVGAGNFSLYHRIQTGSGSHPASYPMDARGSFLLGKAAGA